MMKSALIKKAGRSSAIISIFILCISSGIFVFDAQGQNIRVIGPSEDSQDYAPDSILVRFKANTPENAKASARANVMGQLSKKYHIVEGLEHIKLNGMSVEKATDILNKLPFVEYAEPNHRLYAIEELDQLIPNDTYFDDQWALHNYGQKFNERNRIFYNSGTDDADIDAPEAWYINTSAENVIVAVIDTGIDYTHPDLSGNMWTNPDTSASDVYGYDFVNNDSDPYDDHYHGTHVAGIIAAEQNGIGVVGTAIA